MLLITSRGTGRWIIPKGNPMRGRRPHEAAAIEAWEEAGVRGVPGAAPIGAFRYVKMRGSGQADLGVQVYPLRVVEEADDWPERGQRQRRWFARDAAVAAVAEADLRTLIAEFRPAATALGGPVFRAGMGGWPGLHRLRVLLGAWRRD